MTADTRRIRLHPDKRRADILEAALTLADRDGWLTLTRDNVAQAAGVSPGLVSFYFVAFDLLRAEVMQTAVERGVLRVVAEGIAARQSDALAAPLELRQAAFNSML